MSDLAFQPISVLSERIRRQEISPTDLVQHLLDRISRYDHELRSYITVCEDDALQAAETAAKEIAVGRWRGPLHGIPISHKDIAMTRGVRTTAHSNTLLHHVPTNDATFVKRLGDAGMILLGKTNTTEFACGDQHIFGATPNPWNMSLYSGASSSGSASSLAAGLAVAATGTDTGGSIRAPSSWCGIVGVKPTYGRVSRNGITPLSWTQDHVGPMAHHVADAAILLSAMAGHDPLDPTSSSEPVPDYLAALSENLDGMVLGIPTGHYQEGLDSDVQGAYEAAVTVLEGLGASLVHIDLPTAGRLEAPAQLLVMAEAFGQHATDLRLHGEAYGRKARRQISSGACYGADEYYLAMQLRGAWINELAEAFQKVDVIVTPTLPSGPCTIEAWQTEPPDTSWGTRQFNLAGNPAMTIPCGLGSTGCPIGLQIVAAPFMEAAMFRVGHAFESATDWHTMHPELTGATRG